MRTRAGTKQMTSDGDGRRLGHFVCKFVAGSKYRFGVSAGDARVDLSFTGDVKSNYRKVRKERSERTFQNMRIE